MILLSHTGGHRNGWHVARALERVGLLGEFWTCGTDTAPSPLHAVSPENAAAAPARHELSNTLLETATNPEPPPIPSAAVAPAHGIERIACSQSADAQLSRRLESSRFKAVYAYQDGADESFRVASRRGLVPLYDLPLGYAAAARAMFDEEAVLEPEWAATWPPMPREDLIARQESELSQASLAFVASSFGLRTLEQAPVLPEAVAVIPYGASEVASAPCAPAAAPAPAPATAPLRVLFIGGIGQHNGLSYLLRACRKLRGAVSLTLIGARPTLPCPALERELGDVRWCPPGSADEISAEMAAHDVLVHPSLFSPCNFSFLQAMAMGLPVIVTPNTAAADLIVDGVEGFIVPTRSTDTLIEKLELLRQEPARRAAMSENARRRASNRSWAEYERTLAASITTALRRL